jgi:transcription-repair coupling factor (superfamily II helicase)
MNLSGLLPLLDVPAVSAVASARAGAGRALVGAPDAAKPALIAALAARRRTPVLVITGKADHALTLAEQVALWLGDEAGVLPFPESDTVPYERVAPDHEAAEQRLFALRRLREWRPGAPAPVLVAPALAVAQRTIGPDELGAAALDVRAGERLPMRRLLEILERLGYLFEPLVEEPGQAARRGGIIDVFPPGAPRPLRVELLGDRVDSVREFDAATQRSARVVEQATIGPAREAQLDPARVRALRGRLDLTSVQHGLRPRFEEELDLLGSGSRTDPGFYAPFLLDATVLDHLPTGSFVIVDEPGDTGHLLDELDTQVIEARTALEEQGLLPRGLPLPHASRTEVFEAIRRAPEVVELHRWATDETAGAILPGFLPAPSFAGRLRIVMNEVAAQVRAGRRVVLVSQQSGRLAELFQAEGLAVGIARAVAEAPPPGSLTLLHGSLDGGWVLDLPDGPLTLITDREVFGFTKQRRAERRPARGREAFLSELSPGDYVVHVEHGIARFARLTRRTTDGPRGGELGAKPIEREYLELHYAEGDRLFVPTDQVDRVSRYVGPSDHRPQPTRLGSGDWARAKERVRRAVSDLAQELLRLYAAREFLTGHAFPEDTVWQQEMEGGFPYVETNDQLTALREIKLDMERPRPMDRIVIGDVGYGKTELAVRAAFKAVMDGKQVAVLVPTTVLAQQHYQTFGERVSGFPLRVDVLSRFRSERDQRAIAQDVAAGKIDVLIGTHRILQKDITFKDLGLVVIDEEQRFGVAHKERLKALRQEVDVLTLSATPIPRTLHMSLSGIRDMSTLETAPEDRLPIKTFVSEFDERLIREAVLRELDRGGQVYVVHNRVYNIELIAGRLREIVPEAEIAVGHGQMPEDALEQVMVDFQRGAYDMLVCTTIIESGLDIPNVNTIIINQADRLGLSQLYQLRGRVGRGANRAYAYLLYDRHYAVSEVAQKRLQAIFEASELGAGFQIAVKDLEIRGAGNLLGAEQSGHIGAVGYELYSEMLGEAVKRMRALQRGEMPPPPPPAPVTVDLPLTAHLPEPYIPDLNLRLATYQRFAQVTALPAIDELAAELADRFGPPPPVVQNLMYVVRVRTLARGAGLQSITSEEGVAVLRSPGPIAHRDRLKGAYGENVQIGTAQVRVELKPGWRDTLAQVLERLQLDWQAPAATKGPQADYGTFAVDLGRRDGAREPRGHGTGPSRRWQR